MPEVWSHRQCLRVQRQTESNRSVTLQGVQEGIHSQGRHGIRIQPCVRGRSLHVHREEVRRAAERQGLRPQGSRAKLSKTWRERSVYTCSRSQCGNLESYPYEAAPCGDALVMDEARLPALSKQTSEAMPERVQFPLQTIGQCSVLMMKERMMM